MTYLAKDVGAVVTEVTKKRSHVASVEIFGKVEIDGIEYEFRRTIAAELKPVREPK